MDDDRSDMLTGNTDTSIIPRARRPPLTTAGTDRTRSADGIRARHGNQRYTKSPS